MTNRNLHWQCVQEETGLDKLPPALIEAVFQTLSEFQKEHVDGDFLRGLTEAVAAKVAKEEIDVKN